MKWMTTLISLSSFSLHSAMAMVPFTLSDPVPALSSSYTQGSSNTYIYTLTNNVPNLTQPITVYGISNPVSRVTVANDCGNTMPRGPSTCNIGIQIAPTVVDSGQLINQILSVGYFGRTPLQKTIQFSVPATTLSAMLTAAGQGSSTNPILAQSVDGGNTWSMVSNIVGLPVNGSLSAASCTGGLSTPWCVAGGNNISTSRPLLIQSVDRGQTWETQVVGQNLNNGVINATSCSGTGSQAMCIGVGQFTDPTVSLADAFIVQSNDGGTHWTQASLPAPPPVLDDRLRTASCSGQGANAICIAGGAQSGAPLLLQTRNRGTNWNRITSETNQGQILGSSCSGSDDSATCIAVGVKRPTGIDEPYIIQTTNGGSAWNEPTISGVPARGFFNAASCVGSAGNTSCTAVGSTALTGSALIAHSDDDGSTWSVVNLPTGLTTATLTTISCAGDSSNGYCIAAASNQVIQSNDSGASWSLVSIAGLANTVIFVGSSCSQNGENVICTLVGRDNGATGIIPQVVQTLDTGSNWHIVTVENAPANGRFNRTGTTGTA